MARRVLSRPQLLQHARALFLPFFLRDPHVLLIGHDVGQDGAAEKDHVAPPRRVFDADFEFLGSGGGLAFRIIS